MFKLIMLRIYDKALKIFNCKLNLLYRAGEVQKETIDTVSK
jgi:hypothetical protein